MSNLEQLITKLCPNGVEYKRLSEIAEYSKERIEAKDVNEATYVGVDNLLSDKQGRTNSVYVPVEGRLTKYQVGDILIGNIRPYLKKIWLSDCTGGTNGDVLVIHIFKNTIKPKYLYYILSSDTFFQYDMQNAKGAKMPRGNKEAIMRYSIPVPPLEVQSEIVKILDNFTELTAELSAELSARKQQFEYYQDLLFDNQEYPKVKVKDVIISLKTGLNPRTNFKLNEEKAECFYITGKDIYDNAIHFSERTDKISKEVVTLINRRSQLEDGILLFASTGCSTVGRMAVLEHYSGDWNVSETMYCIKPTNKVLVSFLMYALYSARAKSQYEPKISKGTVPHLKVSDLLEIIIPLPSIKEQKRIVELLSKYDKYCNDITVGIPAELDGRRKQYEYYREKLLAFEKSN